MSEHPSDPREPVDPSVSGAGREGLTGTASSEVYARRDRGREQITIAPDGEIAPAAAPGRDATHAAEVVVAARPSITAPLTGIFYASPAPGSAPYVQVGGEVAVGQVIGLIEAMKLFNEIKSDLAGRVVRVVAESGALVKAKQPLIEVEPL